jgi:hypothetical protein
MLIQFTDLTEKVQPEYYPIPAKKDLPSWYKEMVSYEHERKAPTGDAGTSATIKRCVPVFDAITAGYLLLTPADLWVSQKPSENDPTQLQPFYEWADFGLIQFHPIKQAPTHPKKNGHIVAYPKFMNPWSIKTPKGYSTLFTQPMHRESPFTILDGVVDTDNYFAAVNFPFVLNDIHFEGLIPAGTPFAQVIPFKRDSWKIKLGNKKDIETQERVRQKLKTKFFDAYRNLFWNKKEYN